MAVAAFRCLDRDACFRVDHAASAAKLAHAASDCDCDNGDSGDATAAAVDETAAVQYIDRRGQLTRISVDHAEELMRCSYARRLVFQRASVLRNYAFWGFTPAASGGFARRRETPAAARHSVSRDVAIGHVASLEAVEQTALGLFATAPLAAGAWVGEYTGVVQVDVGGLEPPSDAPHDAYGMCYPSVYEGGQLYLTANEFGNEIRCINHSAAPNVRFTPMVHDDDGLLHVDCFTVRAVAAGEQLFVDYGPTYWQRAGVTPLAAF